MNDFLEELRQGKYIEFMDVYAGELDIDGEDGQIVVNWPCGDKDSISLKFHTPTIYSILHLADAHTGKCSSCDIGASVVNKETST